MTFEWTLLIDLGVIACALLLATFIRAKVQFFQKYLIPNALTAGFLLLPVLQLRRPRLGLGTGEPRQPGVPPPEHLLHLDEPQGRLDERGREAHLRHGGIDHFPLRHPGRQSASASRPLFIITIKPDLFLNFGFFLALGFGLGPGQSFAIGKAWEPSGFANAGNIGLIFAAMGYIWGCIGGVWLINLGRKRGWVDADTHVAIEAEVHPHRHLRQEREGPGRRAPAHRHRGHRLDVVPPRCSSSACTCVAYLVLKLVTWPLLAYAGSMGKQLSDTLWGISFIFAALIGMLVKKADEGAEDRPPPRRGHLQPDRGRLGGPHARRRGRRPSRSPWYRSTGCPSPWSASSAASSRRSPASG